MEFCSVWFLICSYCLSSFCGAVGLRVLYLSNSKSDHPVPYVVIYALGFFMLLSTFISSWNAFVVQPLLKNGQSHKSSVMTVFAYIALSGSVLYRFTYTFSCLKRLCRQIASPLYKFLILTIPMTNSEHIIGPNSPLIGIIHFSIWVLLNSVPCALYEYLSDLNLESDLECLPQVPFLFIGMVVSPLIALLITVLFSWLSTWSPPFMWIYENRKIMKFALETVGSMLFQYFCRFPSIHQIVVFLCLTVFWLGNLAMLQPWSDFGIFNFLLVNACVGSSVNLFNLGILTWIVFAACIVLYFLRLKLDSVTLNYYKLLRRSIEDQIGPLPPQTLSSLRSSTTLLYRPCFYTLTFSEYSPFPQVYRQFCRPYVLPIICNL